MVGRNNMYMHTLRHFFMDSVPYGKGVVIIYGRGAGGKGRTWNLSSSSWRGRAKFQCAIIEGACFECERFSEFHRPPCRK